MTKNVIGFLLCAPVWRRFTTPSQEPFRHFSHKKRILDDFSALGHHIHWYTHRRGAHNSRGLVITAYNTKESSASLTIHVADVVDKLADLSLLPTRSFHGSRTHVSHYSGFGSTNGKTYHRAKVFPRLWRGPSRPCTNWVFQLELLSCTLRQMI